MTNYAYDSLNRLTGLTDFNNGAFNFGYDALGRRTNVTRPNGVSTSYQYDALSRLLSILHQSSAFTGGTSYAYDAAGNRTTRTDTFQPTGGSVTQTATNYSYDSIYELTQAVVNGTATENYNYDAVGNRLSSLGVPAYAYNSSNELTSAGPATFTFDSNGNTLTKTAPNGTTTYAWDFENRLTSVTLPKGTVLHYQYDPFGRRIESDGTGRIFVYDGDNVIEDLDINGKSVARYTQGLGIDEPLEVFGSGASSYYEADGLGSIVSLSNASGAVANTYTYSSFGSVTASTGSVSNRFFFTARESAAKTGLLYYRARYYDPTAGRFLSEDPAGLMGGINFYRYVSNSPLNDTDPSGLWSPEAHDQMAWNALHTCGVSDADLFQIQQGSRSVDENYQGSEYSYMHSMSNGNAHQSALSAETERDSFIQVETQEAAADFRSGNTQQAMFVFGLAMHPVMEMTSPAHVDANGSPIPWCGLTGCAEDRAQVLQHSPNDYSGIERTRDLNAHLGIQHRENEMMRSYFEAVTGRKLNCGCKGK